MLVFFLLLGCNGVTTASPTTIISTSVGELSIALNPGVDTVEVNKEFIDAGAIAYYNDIELAITVSESNVDLENIGAYYI